MRACPYCNVEVSFEAKVCKACGHAVVKKCPHCAEEIQPQAVWCRFCQTSLERPSATAGSAGLRVANHRPVGEERGLVVTVLLVLVTCGIWWYVVLYKMGEELNAHQGKTQINPGTDLLLNILTCGMWGIYLMYQYPRVFQEITVEEGGPEVDLTTTCLLLACFSIMVPALGLVAVLVFQSELNRHWEMHRTVVASGS